MNTDKISAAGRRVFLAALCATALVVQTGCAPAIKAPPSSPAATLQTPPARSARLAEESAPGLIATEIEGKTVPERRYSFSLRDSDIREVLMAIAKQTSISIVVDPKAKGTVTVDLKNVTLTEALDTLTDLLELNYSIKGNIVRVFEPVPETKIFSLQYVNLRRLGFSTTSAQIGATGGGTTGTIGIVGIPGLGGTTGVSGGGSAVGGVSGTTGGVGGTSSQSTVTTTLETDLWKDIDAGLAKIISPKGKVVLDKLGGNILVTDFPRYLDRIASFLERVEGSVQRQVLIEARIIEVVLKGDYKFGIDWGAIAKIGALRGASGASPGKILRQQLATDSRGFQIGVTSTDFTALLDVLSEQGELNVISSPKLATLNNQTAVIRAGTDQIIFNTQVQEIPTLTGTQTIKTVTPQTVTIGVVLSVTPQISPDEAVVLHIRPTVTEQVGTATSALGDKFPILDVREADMVVRAREGQVIVIGGLMQEKKNDDERKVPLLGDLPGIGRLFRSTTQERKKTELVVLLSPTVMIGKKVDEITARELERLNKVKGASPW